MPNDIDLWSLIDLATPWAIHVAVTLRIAEHLASGKSYIGALAQAAGADADALARVLRHLVQKGIFTEPRPGEFALNDAAGMLMEPGARLALDLDGFGGRMVHAWGGLLSVVRTGRTAYADIFGKPYWDDLAAHPELAAQFDALMGPAGHGTPSGEVLLDNDWSGIHTVVDVGGGTGALLAVVLKDHPTLRGTLVDLPTTVARAAEFLHAAGVADRVTTLGQSFFDPLPPGADLYLIKNVLADWPDAEALALLTRCAQAMAAGGRSTARLMILGGVSRGETPSPELLMLVLVGGKSRTLSEFAVMAQKAGLIVRRSGDLQGRFAVECAVG